MLYDHRDNLSTLTMEVSDHVDAFRGMVDKEKVTIPLRSPISLLFPLYTRRMKSCWVKTSLNRDHRPTQNFSRPLSNTGQSFQRSSATGRKSKMENLALPNFVKRKSILMQSCCVLSEASEERCSAKYPEGWQGKLKLLERLIGGSL